MKIKILMQFFIFIQMIAFTSFAKTNCDETYKGYTQFINIKGSTLVKIETENVCGKNLNDSLNLKDSIITIQKENKILAKLYTKNAIYDKNRQKIITNKILPLAKFAKGLQSRRVWTIDFILGVIRAPKGIYYEFN